jgi:hypothetical protein
VNRGDIGCGPHRLEFLGVLFLAHILGLVYLQQYMGRVADHVGLLIGGEEYGSSVTQPDDVAHFGCPDAGKAGIV